VLPPSPSSKGCRPTPPSSRSPVTVPLPQPWGCRAWACSSSRSRSRSRSKCRSPATWSATTSCKGPRWPGRAWPPTPGACPSAPAPARCSCSTVPASWPPSPTGTGSSPSSSAPTAPSRTGEATGWEQGGGGGGEGSGCLGLSRGFLASPGPCRAALGERGVSPPGRGSGPPQGCPGRLRGRAGVLWRAHPLLSVPCSLNVNRYPPTNYDQVHLHPHLFPEQPRVSPSSYSPSGGVGFPPAQQALKVPQLEQYPSFPQNAHQQQQHYTVSALQQALLSPTPPDYSRHQQVPHILQGLLSPRHSLTGHTDMRLPQAEFAQLIKRRQQQQQQQEFQELFRHMSQGDAGNMGTSVGQNLSERQSLSLPYQSADTYHPQNSPQHLLKIRAQECIPQVPASVPPHGYVHQPALFHSESMEEDCACEGARDSFPDSKSSNTLTKGCHETPLLVSAGGRGDPEPLLGTAGHAPELGTQPYRHPPAAAFGRNKVPSRESIVGNCMDRSSPGQAMQVPDHNGLGYPARPAASEHPRPRTLQRHHTIQNSDDAYVGLEEPVPAGLTAARGVLPARGLCPGG
uniref:Uncharacterized protein n=1 Tax=Strix occidentalis caurina TaxID=311401 RepID=A0A8D0EJS0_STROC